MKVYIDNYPVQDLFSNIARFEKYYKSTNIWAEFYTHDGVFTIEKNQVFKMKVVDVDITRADNLIIDKSYYAKHAVYQLPPDHIVHMLTQMVYATLNIKLVVEGFSKNDIFTPFNFYFDVDDNLSLHHVKNEIKLFL
jgi:hypothetical protein